LSDTGRQQGQREVVMAMDTASTGSTTTSAHATETGRRPNGAPARPAHRGRANGAAWSAAELKDGREVPDVQDVRTDFARLAQEAHDDAVRVSVSEAARTLQDTLGQSLTGLIADVRNAKAVGQWARGARLPHPETAQRLRHAYHVVRLLRPVERPAGIRAWFLGLNPLLDDTPPAIALRTDPAAVLKAARAFAFHG
jgi:hypothetical protein